MEASSWTFTDEVARTMISLAKNLSQVVLPPKALGRIRLWCCGLMYAQLHDAGQLVPPPYAVKHLVLRQYQHLFQLSLLVETGTYQGTTVETMRSYFQRIISIELDATLAATARTRFAGVSEVNLLEGDSARLLPEVVSGLKQPALFWLDGHYSSAGTAKGDKETPIMEEVASILSPSVKQPHVILIDDARMFTGHGDYPTLNRLKNLVRSLRPDYVFSVSLDIIRAHPSAYLHEAGSTVYPTAS